MAFMRNNIHIYLHYVTFLIDKAFVIKELGNNNAKKYLLLVVVSSDKNK